MRSRSFQNVLLILVFGAILAGLTFARQWLASPPAAPISKRTDPNTAKSYIRFGGVTLAGVNYEMAPNRGHQDLLFENVSGEDLELGLDSTNCRRCTSVDLTLISEQELEKLRTWLPAASATQVGMGPNGPLTGAAPALLCLDGTRSIVDEGSRWQRMLEGEVASSALFKISAKGQGLLRLVWEGRKTGPERIKAGVWTQPVGKENLRVYTGVELPLVFVTPLMVSPSLATVDLGSGDRKEVSFWCWSATRAGFRLKAREESAHPCFSCACLPLVGEEYQLAMQAVKVGGNPPSVLCGYQIVVNVAERLDSGAQLDLGHFTRRIILTSPDIEFGEGMPEHAVTVRGQVHGEVTVGLITDRDQVNLGIYPKTRGTTKEVPVETLKPGLKLKLLDRNPPFLDVHLKETRSSLEGTHYKMTVTVPKNQSYLPEDSAIILETVDNPPRKVRIPVAGIATIPVR
jgi:hypothetical protein